MKKLRYIIPVILIIASLFGIYSLTVYDSPYKFYKLSVFDDDGKYLNEDFANTYSILEKAYDISPNESVLYALSRMSCPGDAVFRGGFKAPDGFFKKCEIYNKKALEYIEISGALRLYEGPFDGLNLDRVGDLQAEYLHFNAKCNLAYAMFMQNKTEEAKHIIGEYIKEYTVLLENGNDYDSAAFAANAPRRFFEDTYALSQDQEYKDWVIEKEIELTKLLQKYQSEDVKFVGENMYENRTYEELLAEYNYYGNE